MRFGRVELEIVDTSKLSSVFNVNGLLQFTSSSYHVNLFFIAVLIKCFEFELSEDSGDTSVTEISLGVDLLCFKDLILLKDLVRFRFRSELKGAG